MHKIVFDDKNTVIFFYFCQVSKDIYLSQGFWSTLLKERVALCGQVGNGCGSSGFESGRAPKALWVRNHKGIVFQENHCFRR